MLRHYSFAFLSLALSLTAIAQPAAAPVTAPSPRPTVLRFAVKGMPEGMPAEVTGHLYRHKGARAAAAPLLVYLHGGGCKYSSYRAPTDFEDLLRQLYEASFDVLSVDWDTGINDLASVLSLDCVVATRAHLARARTVATRIRTLLKKSGIPAGHIALTGHSYGGYLVNQLVSDTSARLEVDSFISIAGVWKPWIDGRSENEVGSPVFTPVAAKPALARPLLVVHARDDRAVPVAQVDLFREWARPLPASSYQVTLLESGDHRFVTPDSMQALARVLREFIADRSK